MAAPERRCRAAAASAAPPPPATPHPPPLAGPAPRPPHPQQPDPQAATPLLDAVLARGADTSAAAFHIPGHKKGGQAEEEDDDDDDGGGDSGRDSGRGRGRTRRHRLARLRSLAGRAALSHDLTELAGLDVLACPAGPIAAAQALAAAAVGAGATRFCVNGATGGLAAAVVAACTVWRGEGRRQRRAEAGGAAAAAAAVASSSSSPPPPPLILAARNCHQSVFAAAAVAGAEVEWVAPGPAPAGWAGVAPPLAAPALAAALAALAAAGRPRPAAVVIVSPNYFGQVADVQALAAAAAPIPLLVDEAHGPHFGAHPAFPPPSIALGAAAAVVSAHKVWASLGQAAAVHVSARAAAAPPAFLPALDAALGALQTSSPSYLLLASLDAGRAAAFEGGGVGWEAPLGAAAAVRAAVLAAAPAGVRLLPGAADPLRITFAVDAAPPPPGGGGGGGGGGGRACCCGLGVAAALEAGGAVPEAALPGGAVVLALGAGSGRGAAARFAPALAAVLAARDAGGLALAGGDCPGGGGGGGGEASPPPPPGPPPPPAVALSPADALFGGRGVVAVPLAAAPGRVAAAALTPYPPGIPAVLPGEVVSEGLVRALVASLGAGGRVTGVVGGEVKVFE